MLKRINPMCIAIVIGTMLPIQPPLLAEQLTSIIYPVVHSTCLPFPGANRSTFPLAINVNGDIVGTYRDCFLLTGGGNPSSLHAFLLSGGRFSEFQVPSSVAPFSGVRETLPTGINAQGDIVGNFGVIGNTGPQFAFLLRNGQFARISPPGANLVGTTANGINDRGDVVGTFLDAEGRHVYVLHDGTYTTIDVPENRFFQPTGINSRGDIIGYFDDAMGRSHGCLLRDGVFSVIDMEGATRLVSINDNGVILGQFRSSDFFEDSAAAAHNFVIRLTDEPDSIPEIVPFDIPGLANGLAYGINNQGSLVGTFFGGPLDSGGLFGNEIGFLLTD